MTILGKVLLLLGLFCPLLSLISGVTSALVFWRTGRYSSAVFIPFVGPLLLTVFVFVERISLWVIPVVWLADIGTLAFLYVLPRLVREWWNTSSFTRIMTLRGNDGIQNAVLTLHSTGHYLLKKSWNRSGNEPGIVGLGEPGTFSVNGNDFELLSHFGLERRLTQSGDGSFLVEEQGPDQPERSNHSLHQWLLKSLPAASPELR